jgi:hypothetical protein
MRKRNASPSAPPAARTAIPQAVSGIRVLQGAAAPLAGNPRIPAHITLQIINGINKIPDKFIRRIQVMPRYRQRHIESKLREYSKYFKAILVTGARQVGKSTLLGHLLPGMKTFVFDPVQDLYGARRDPDLFLENFPPPLVLDEIQYVPELLPALKRKIDNLQKPGQYFLTGSQNLAMLRSVAESMAGRIGILHLEGMTAYELFDRPDAAWLRLFLDSPERLIKESQGVLDTPPLSGLLWRGSMPAIIDMPDTIIPDYYRSYIQTYVERDARIVEDIRELASFSRFLALCAALSGQEINASHLGREIGITPATARRWLDLLINTYQWLELFPYHGNTIKRVSGKRKGYWRDTGIVSSLQRITSPDSLAVNPLFGALFETWVANCIFRQTELQSTPPQLYHWRTAGGAEVDLIMELDGRLYPMEVKSKSSLSGHDTSGLRAFRQTYDPNRVGPGLIIYAGKECFRLDRDTIALPWNIIAPQQG